MISTIEFDTHYEVVRNRANGNCLFDSISYLMNCIPSEDGYSQVELHQEDVRSQVYEFYKDFDRDIKYPDDTIEQAIVLGLMFENQDENEHGDYISHDRNVINDRVWGSLVDILVCSMLFDVDVNLFINHGNAFRLDKIKFQYKNKHTLDILYNGVNHFEALQTTFV